MPFRQRSSVCNISDDWRQATASLSDNLCLVPSSLPLSVIRVFVILFTQQQEETLFCEVATALFLLFCHVFLVTLLGRVVKYCDKYVCLSMCLFVCLSVRTHNSKTVQPNFTEFLCMFPVALAWSISDDIVIRYVQCVAKS